MLWISVPSTLGCPSLVARSWMARTGVPSKDASQRLSSH